ncbi:MAG: VanZ family protein [Pseudomonadota bacterium]
MTPTIGWRALFCVLFVVVTYLTVTPNPDTAGPGNALTDFLAELLFGSAQNADKIGHFIAYLALGGSAVLARLKVFGARAASLVVIALYGAFLEVVQGWTAVRSPELLDAAANAGGTLASYPLALLFERSVTKIFGKYEADKNTASDLA